MSIKVFLGIKKQEDNKIIEEITKALEDKYIECHIDKSNAIEAKKLLQNNQYDLIIADNKVVPSLSIFEVANIQCPFLYISPAYNEGGKKNLIVINNNSSVLDWIKKQKVTTEDLAKSLRNKELIQAKKNKDHISSIKNEDNRITVDTVNRQDKENHSDSTNKSKIKKESSNKESTKFVPSDNSKGEDTPPTNQADSNGKKGSSDQNKKKEIKKDSDLPQPNKSKGERVEEDKKSNEKEEEKNAKPSYFNELYDEAVRLVLQQRTASVNMLQNTFKLGFQEGSELLALMEQNGIVSPYEKGKARKVLVEVSNNDTEVINSSLIVGPLEDDESDYIGKKVSNTVFATPTYNLHRVIGVWSPQGGKGTTTFIMNFAMYLGKLKYNVAVLEGISNRQSLKLNLQRFTDVPEGWDSWAKTHFKSEVDEEEALRVQWVYNNVSWLPLNDKDPSLNWNYNKLFSYINNVKKYNLVFVDFPGGYMDQYSLYNLDYIDELWIIMDNNINQMKEFKRHIHSLVQAGTKREAIPTKLICTHEYYFSECEDYGAEMELPLLTSIPSLNIEAQKNLFQKKPLIEYPKIKKKLLPSFETIRSQLNVKPDEKIILKKKPLLAKIQKFLLKY